MRQRKDIRHAVRDALAPFVASDERVQRLIVGRLDQLPKANEMVVRIDEVDVEDDAGELLIDGSKLKVEAVATLTVSYVVGDNLRDTQEDQLDDVMQEVHNRITADRTLGGKAQSVSYAGFEVDATDNGSLVIGTALYDVTYPRRV